MISIWIVATASFSQTAPSVAWHAPLQSYFSEGVFDKEYLFIACHGFTILNAKNGAQIFSMPTREQIFDDELASNSECVYYLDQQITSKSDFRGHGAKGSSTILCFDRSTARQIWKKKIELVQSIAADDNGLYFVRAGSEFGKFSPLTGDPVWTKKIGVPTGESAKLFASEGVLVSSFDFRDSVAVSASTGTKLWSRNGKHGFYPVALPGVAIFRSDKLLGCDLKTGSVAWQYPFSDFNADTHFADGKVFFHRDGVATCLDLKSGKSLWQKPISELIYADGGNRFDRRAWHFQANDRDWSVRFDGKILWSQKMESSFFVGSNGVNDFYRSGKKIFAVGGAPVSESSASKDARLWKNFESLSKAEYKELIALRPDDLKSIVNRWLNPKEKSIFNQPSEGLFDAFSETLSDSSIKCLDGVLPSKDRFTLVKVVRLLLQHSASAFAQSEFVKMAQRKDKAELYYWVEAAQTEGVGASEDLLWSALVGNSMGVNGWGLFVDSKNAARKAEAMKHLTGSATVGKILDVVGRGKSIGTFKDSKGRQWQLIESFRGLGVYWAKSAVGTFCLPRTEPSVHELYNGAASDKMRADWKDYLKTGWRQSVEDFVHLSRDADGDGLTDYFEQALGLNSSKKDSDNDGIFDMLDSQPLGSKRKLDDAEKILAAAIVAMTMQEPGQGPLCILNADISSFEVPGVSGSVLWNTQAFPVRADLNALRITENAFAKKGSKPGIGWREKYLTFTKNGAQAELEISGGSVQRIFYGCNVVLRKIDGRWIVVSIREAWIA